MRKVLSTFISIIFIVTVFTGCDTVSKNTPNDESNVSSQSAVFSSV